MSVTGRWKAKSLLAAVTMRAQAGLQESRPGPLQGSAAGQTPASKRGPRKFIDEEGSHSKKLKTGPSWTAGSPERVPRVLCAWTRSSLQNSNTKKALHRKRKLGQTTWEEYGSPVQDYRDVLRKATAHLDWNLLGGLNGYLFIRIWS